MRSAPSAPRLRASLACQSCRRRKVKCDAQTTPASLKCTPCHQLNIPCLVDRHGDRRKSGSRKHVETLEQRIRGLESLLRQSPQRPSWEMDGSPVDVLASPPATTLSDAFADPLADFHSAPSVFDLDSFLPVADGNATTSTTTFGLQPQPQQQQIPTPETLLLAESCPPNNSKSPSDCPWALGPTSPSHLRLSGAPLNPAYSKPDELADLGIAVDKNSPQVQNRLLQVFFQYQTLWVSVVDRALFEEHRETAGGKSASMWYSPFLETVMLACAARLSTSSSIRSLAEQYSTQAKAALLETLESPSAAVMQGYLLLSEYEVTHGRERVGWQLCGMACRLLSDLGLHDSLDHATGQDAIATRRARIQLVGACIAFEGPWCMYLGRPSSLPRTIIQTAAASICDDQYRDLVSPTLAAWVSLCHPMAEVCDILNSSGALDEDGRTRLTQLDLELRRWTQTLPPGFQLKAAGLGDLEPTAYGVHTQCCKVRILIMQALGDVEGQGKQAVYEESIHIIRLLLTYQQVHGAERIPSIMLDNANLALVTLMQQYVQQLDLNGRQAADLQWIQLAIRSMVQMYVHFPVVGRMVDSWRVLVEGTPLASLVPREGPSHPRIHSLQTPEYLLGGANITGASEHLVAGPPNRAPQPSRHEEQAATSMGALDAFPSAHGTRHKPRWPLQCPEDLAVSLLAWPPSHSEGLC